MFRNSHFALATHVLVILAIRKDERVSSADMARSINTNPAFLRVLLGRLKDAQLIDVQQGKGGGAFLSVDPSGITLRAVFHAVNEDPGCRVHSGEPSQDCVVGRNILGALGTVIQRVERSVDTELEQTTIADLARRIRKKG